MIIERNLYRIVTESEKSTLNLEHESLKQEPVKKDIKEKSDAFQNILDIEIPKAKNRSF